MKVKLSNPGYSPLDAAKGKQSIKEYLDAWVNLHGKANLRPSTYATYKGYIKNHINPNIGHINVNQLTPAMLDDMFIKLFDKGLSQSTVRYVQRILSVAFEHAKKYRYIEHNPVRDIITKFGKQGKTPEPYTVEQIKHFIGKVIGTQWEMPVVLAGLYGLRISEVIGLRWKNVDLTKKHFIVQEQMPFKLPAGTKIVDQMAPTKSKDRTLPITDVALPYFLRQYEAYIRQKEMIISSGGEYHDNGFVVSKPDGAPERRDKMSSNFGQLIRRLELPHIRFHDLRHSAATNMHELTGDFYTVGEILGHTLKGIGMTLGISGNLESTTARYVDVRLDRKKDVLDIYHNSLNPKKDTDENSKKKNKNKNNDMEL